ncbi:MAG: hypothetical protein E7452_00425 [Ruminococcaceae bacterium]|nr:hypothetical protein [Oscillospiraceae bacterium]MBQ4048865.1 hypothetical protein [Clostridia bacterium]
MANGRNKYDEPLTTQRVNEKRLTRVTWILALAQLVVIGAMVALMFTPFAKVVFVCAVPYIMLYVYYMRGVETIVDIGCKSAGLFRAFKFISPLLFAVAFVMAIFS